jgi:hypothetical protein
MRCRWYGLRISSNEGIIKLLDLRLALPSGSTDFYLVLSLEEGNRTAFRNVVV